MLKFEIDLDKPPGGDDFGTTIASIIRSYIVISLRTSVRITPFDLVLLLHGKLEPGTHREMDEYDPLSWQKIDAD